MKSNGLRFVSWQQARKVFEAQHAVPATLVAAILIQVGFSGLAFGAKSKKAKESPTPTVLKLTVGVPSLAALAETPQSQTKGGLRMTMVPETYKTQESWTMERRQVPPPTKFWVVVQPAPNAVYVEQTRTPHFTVAPDTLVFRLHLNNELPRVFRGAGIAVQFNVAGKVVPVDPSGYGDLVNIILPPRSEQEVTILGPKIAGVAAPSTVGVFLYDVVTGMDNAGNVTEKQNFEWYFSYQTQTTEKEFSVPPPTQGWIVPNQ